MAGRTVRYQGGSIVSFIIITVIIIAALGVGLYALRQRSEQSRISSTATQDIPPELPGARDDESTDDAEDKTDKTDSETFPSSSDETASDDKDESKGVAATGSDSDDSSRTGASSPVTALPETGPGQIVILPILAVIAYVTVAYINSSRRLAELRS